MSLLFCFVCAVLEIDAPASEMQSTCLLSQEPNPQENFPNKHLQDEKAQTPEQLTQAFV